jgi:hypothetical protein
MVSATSGETAKQRAGRVHEIKDRMIGGGSEENRKWKKEGLLPEEKPFKLT